MLATNCRFMIGLASIVYLVNCATIGDGDESGLAAEAAPWMTVSRLRGAGAIASGLGGLDAPRITAPLVCVQPATARLMHPRPIIVS